MNKWSKMVCSKMIGMMGDKLSVCCLLIIQSLNGGIAFNDDSGSNSKEKGQLVVILVLKRFTERREKTKCYRQPSYGF